MGAPGNTRQFHGAEKHRGEPAPGPFHPGDHPDHPGRRAVLPGPLPRLMSRFVRMLRRHGFRCGTRGVLDGLRAVEAVGAAEPADVRSALRAVFAQNEEHVQKFDQLFDMFWLGRRRPSPADGFSPPEGVRTAAAPEAPGAPAREDDEPHPPGAGDGSGGEGASSNTPRTGGDEPGAAAGVPAGEGPPDGEEEVVRVAYTPVAARGGRDFARMDDELLPELRILAERVARKLSTRRSRRTRVHPKGRRPDHRGTLRASLRYGGDPGELVRRKRRIRRTKLVVLCDVSGSMDVYARYLLQFLYALQQVAAGNVETFVFSTDLKKVTGALKNPDGAAAIKAAVDAAPDWAGGTRIGASLRTFSAKYGQSLIDRDTVLIILSDGLDTGDIEVLERHMKRLKAKARKIIWLNPLAGDSRYEPLARGMEAALPYVDVLAPCHNLDSLLALERYL